MKKLLLVLVILMTLNCVEKKEEKKEESINQQIIKLEEKMLNAETVDEKMYYYIRRNRLVQGRTLGNLKVQLLHEKDPNKRDELIVRITEIENNLFIR